MMTCQGSFDTVQEALRVGAFGYLSKPIESLDLITQAVDRSIKMFQMIERNRGLKEWLNKR